MSDAAPPILSLERLAGLTQATEALATGRERLAQEGQYPAVNRLARLLRAIRPAAPRPEPRRVLLPHEWRTLPRGQTRRTP